MNGDEPTGISAALDKEIARLHTQGLQTVARAISLLRDEGRQEMEALEARLKRPDPD